MSRENDTIIAPATPLGKSAIAMVRLDGPRTREIVKVLSGRDDFDERVATFVTLRDGDEAIDEAVVTQYLSRRSYTGNDLAELTVHGSPFVVGRVMDAAISLGARLAEPGEFTERAVLNGKLDLIQAEAVGDLIASRTALQARLSLDHLEGDLSRLALAVREELLHVISRLEAALDFSDEGYEFIDRNEAVAKVVRAIGTLVEVAETYRRGRAASRGLTAVILGRPNAGKSTLLNFFCGSDRAIVTSIPGTTRDLLHETIEVGGLPVTFVDTAGLRDGAGEVEEIGIRRAREAASRAEIVMYLIDAAKGETDEDRREIAALTAPFVIFTKTDLREPGEGAFGVSVVQRSGLDKLLGELDRRVADEFAPPEGVPAIVNERQKRAVEDTLEGLRSAVGSLEAAMSEELVLVDLYRAAESLGTLVGTIRHEEVIEEIFAKFCIGK